MAHWIYIEEFGGCREGMMSLRKQEGRWENETKMDLKEVGSESLDGVYLVWDRDK